MAYISEFYDSKLNTNEMLVIMLNRKYNTNFGINDFNVKLINSKDNKQLGTVTCTFEISHINQDIYPGTHRVVLDTIKYDDNYVTTTPFWRIVQPGIFFIDKKIDNENCILNHGETADELNKNPILKLNYLFGMNLSHYSQDDIPSIYNYKPLDPIKTGQYGGKLTIKEKLHIGYVPPLKDEPHCNFRYVTKMLKRVVPAEMDRNKTGTVFKLKDDKDLTRELIDYFKREWGEEWNDSSEGYGLGDCFQINDMPWSPSATLRYIYVPENGIRPCGIIKIYDIMNDKFDVPKEIDDIDDTCFSLFDTNGNGLNLEDRFNPFAVTMYDMAGIRVGGYNIDKVVDCINYSSFSDTYIALHKAGIIAQLINGCYNYHIPNREKFYQTSPADSLCYSTNNNTWYKSKINIYHYQNMPHNQIEFKTDGFDLGKIFKDTIIVDLVDSKGNKIPLREAIRKVTKVILPTESEGLIVTKNEKQKTYTLKAVSGFATFLFKKNSELVVKYR